MQFTNDLQQQPNHSDPVRALLSGMKPHVVEKIMKAVENGRRLKFEAFAKGWVTWDRLFTRAQANWLITEGYFVETDFVHTWATYDQIIATNPGVKLAKSASKIPVFRLCDDYKYITFVPADPDDEATTDHLINAFTGEVVPYV